MTVTAREAFKLGFLQRCADEKLTPEQVSLRIKRAEVSVSGLVHALKEHLGKGFETHPWLTGGSLAGAAVGLPIMAGVGAGHLARKLQGDFVDPEDVQKQELINEMNTLAGRSHHSQSKALGL